MTYIDKVKNKLGEKINVNDKLLDLCSLLVLCKGDNTTLENVHDAWAIEKNSSFHEHRSIVPFNELTEDVQEIDRKYMEAIRETAKELEEKEK